MSTHEYDQARRAYASRAAQDRWTTAATGEEKVTDPYALIERAMRVEVQRKRSQEPPSQVLACYAHRDRRRVQTTRTLAERIEIRVLDWLTQAGRNLLD